MAGQKAASQNLLHPRLLVTDAVECVLSEDDVGPRVGSMSGDVNATGDRSEEEVVELLEAMLN